MAIKLEVKNLYKVFGEHPQRAFKYIEKGLSKEQILEKTGLSLGVKDASLAIEEGEIFVIMGLSGSGKSTMVRLLNRLIEPTRGQVLIDGEDIAKISDAELREVRRKKIAMVFQSFALMPHMTVSDNTAFGMELAGIPAQERQEKALDALRQVGLENYAHAYPDELSGGMRQRVGLARALAINPDILLMDEAFSALDPLIRTEMQDELVKLQAKHQRTIVFISHDLDEAMRIGDRIKTAKWYRWEHRMRSSITRPTIMCAPSSVAWILARYLAQKILPAERQTALFAKPQVSARVRH